MSGSLARWPKRPTHKQCIAIGASVLALTGIGVLSGGSHHTAPTATAALAAETTEEPSSRCVRVSPAVLSAIKHGLTVNGGGAYNGGGFLGEGWAVRSHDYRRAYFVAAEINGSGMYDGGDVGLWVTNTLDGEQFFYSVNSLALTFSDWGDRYPADAHFSQSDDGAPEALDCAGG